MKCRFLLLVLLLYSFSFIAESKVVDANECEDVKYDQSCLCAITAFFNPLEYKSRFRNYYVFRNVTKSQGLFLVTVQLRYIGSVLKLIHRDADILVDIELHENDLESTLMWQKERLLNIALDFLPRFCQNVAWIDADVIFHNNNWIRDTCIALDTFTVLQPFSTVTRLDDSESSNYMAEIFAFETSIARNSTVQRIEGKSFPGFVWAIRRSVLESVRFFDTAIVGGADTLMAAAFHNPISILEQRISNEEFESLKGISKLSENYLLWAKDVYNLTHGQIGKFSNSFDAISHLWHGDIRDRQYSKRYRILQHARFDPDVDLVLYSSTNDTVSKSIWKWSLQSTEDKRTAFSPRKQLMHSRVKRFFEQRYEDGY